MQGLTSRGSHQAPDEVGRATLPVQASSLPHGRSEQELRGLPGRDPLREASHGDARAGSAGREGSHAFKPVSSRGLRKIHSDVGPAAGRNWEGPASRYEPRTCLLATSLQ